MSAAAPDRRTPRRPVGRSLLERPAAEVAPLLIGCVLERRTADADGRPATLAVRIVETEAYCGPEDLASHAAGGRRTARNASMYARPGTAYVYFTYGMHFCFNVVCAPVDRPEAVLIRAAEPLEGLDVMAANRTAARPATARGLSDRDLCSGPAKLCRALAIDRELDGIDLLGRCGSRLRLLSGGPEGWPVAADLLVQTARIGLGPCGEWAQRPLRWLLGSSEHVSRRAGRR